MSKHYDYIAIGGGSGGIASINRAAMYGQKCALIEAKDLGGTCVNVGCVPKKVMWHAAQIREAIHLYGPDYGFDTTINHFDWDNWSPAVAPISIVSTPLTITCWAKTRSMSLKASPVLSMRKPSKLTARR